MIPIYVFVGGGLGSLARWLMNEWLGSPYSTLVVNLAGSFLIGLLLARFESQAVIFLAIVGFLGGFTTFSGFSIDVLRLMESHQLWWMGYLLLSVLGSILLCGLGRFIGLSIL